MHKRVLSIIVVLTLSVLFLNNTVLAVNVTPYWNYTRSYSSTLTISGATATCISQATGYAGKTTKIVISQILQKKNSTGNWSKVKSWDETDTGYKGSATNKAYNLSKGTYRLKSVFTVYATSKYETITKYSSEKAV